MSIKKFYTKEVEIYEKAKNLDSRLEKLIKSRNFIFENYDSNVSVTIEASSHHNYNTKNFKKILLPTDIILGYQITKKFILERLDLEIKNIKEQLEKLNIEFENLSK